MKKRYINCDGNTAAANIAYKFSEIAAIYPITPSSPMGELADLWASKNQPNLFNTVPKVQEMQSEGGAAGAIHGALTAGALTTTFTASQGLLLMLPNMFKIAGEMLPTVFHVASRSLAYQSLSIFGDHSDVMATRGTGFALLSSSNIQEAQDMAVIAHLATLESKIPFLHFFDGFRVSHSINKIETIDDDTLKSMVDYKFVQNFRNRSIRPEKPFVKVGAQNPDVYFQGRETVNKYYQQAPEIVKKYMNIFSQKTGRTYNLFQYYGSPDAERLIVSMGSSTDTIKETIDYLTSKGEKVGLVIVHLYRPFSIKDFLSQIPKSVKKIAVLDRTKEAGSVGEPLYLDVVAAFSSEENPNPHIPNIYGGRYGLSSKEFTPSMVNAIYKFLKDKPHHNFTIGINDDVTKTSIKINEKINSENKDTIRCKFWGYGSDGTVSANKNTIKIIGESTDKFVSAYFEYDSKKSGGVTISHLRFSDKQILSQYDVDEADIISLHKCSYIRKYNVLKGIKEGGIFLINSHYSPEELFQNLTKELQDIILEKNIKVYTIDATKLAKEVGLGHRINTIMQVAFFKLANIIDLDKSLELIKEHTKKQYASKGEEIINKNIEAINKSLDELHEATIEKTSKHQEKINLIPEDADTFTKNVIKPIMELEGNSIKVSDMPLDGKVPLNTTKLEKRCATDLVPYWDASKCIQCGQCSFVCPHAAIRTKQIHPDDLKNAPKNFEVLDSKTKNNSNLKFRVQVYPEDCLGCKHCVIDCPTNALKMIPLQESLDKGEAENQKFFDNLPDNVLEGAIPGTIQESQLRKPYFEFSGACAGCGETPYIKLVTQLFGDKMVIANATGCSSIFGGTFPIVPFALDNNGKGPAWANSLFEDNAEYGLGMKIGIDKIKEILKKDIENLIQIGTTYELQDALKKLLQVWENKNNDEQVKEVLKLLPSALQKVYGDSEEILKRINENKDFLSQKSVWIIGGDGWAYDIGFGGLDHVVAQGKNVNILILDNEQYANTGGQTSKSTPRGATAKFSVAGKDTPKKNLGLMMMSYGNVYVASINYAANKMQTLKAIKEAEEFDGPSIIIAYSNCIAHGSNMETIEKVSKDAFTSGYWPMYRYNPNSDKKLIWEEQKLEGFEDYIYEQNRYSVLKRTDPERAKKLLELAKTDNLFRNQIIKSFNTENKDC